MTRGALTLLLAMVAGLSPSKGLAESDLAAEEALRLVPRNAAAVLVLSDLRTQLTTIVNSSLARRACELAVVRAWSDSDDFKRFEKSRAELEMTLGVTWSTLRDEVLGDAVLLSIQAGDGEEGLGHPRGLFLTRIRNLEPLRILIGRINGGEAAGGSLVSLDHREHRGIGYDIRRFRPNTKPDEAYILLDDRWFAWSNSEQTIRDVIDRKIDGGMGYAEIDELKLLREALPVGAIASLYVGPQFTAEVARAFRSSKEGGEPLGGLLASLIGAVRAFGLTLRWDEGVLVDVHEVLEPDQLPARVRGIIQHSASVSPLAPGALAPAGSLALLSFRADWQAVAELVRSIVPEHSRAAWDGGEAVLQGLLLGYGPRTEVAPAIGPEALVAVVPAGQAGERWVDVVAVVPVSGDSLDPRGIPAAVRNAIRTGAGMLVLDDLEKEREPVRSLTDSVVDGLMLTVLGAKDRTTLAFALSGGRLILGTSSHAVSGARTPSAPAFAASLPPLDRASVVLAVDIAALVSHAQLHRAFLVDKLSASGGGAADLDRSLELLGLFRLGYAVHEVADDAASAHQQFGILGRTGAR